MNVRDAEAAELDALARIWHDGWHEAHAALVAPDLTALRTLDNFHHRLAKDLPDVRVVGPINDFDQAEAIIATGDADLVALAAVAVSHAVRAANASERGLTSVPLWLVERTLRQACLEAPRASTRFWRCARPEARPTPSGIILTC